MLSKSALESWLKGFIYSSFFVPLVVIPSSFIFPFIVPKVLAFRILVMLMLGAYSLLLISDWHVYKPRLTGLTLAILAFIASFTISTFAGVDSYHSFWDNHERMLGLFTILHYGVYFLVCTGICKDWTAWRRALRVFLGAGALVMIIGMIQVFKPTFLLNQGDKRIIGTLGNAIYMGGYGLFLMFVAALLFLKEEVRGWRIAYLIAGILGMLGMFFSGTRGSILGLVASLLFIVIGYVVTLKNQPRVRQGVAIAGIIGVIIAGFLYGFRKTSFVTNLPAVGRVVNTSWEDFKESPRYIAWEIALKAWKEKPVFGWGPNNFYFAFNKYYNPRSLDFGYGETWFDNAHNIIVNTMAVQGTVGIITYLAIFLVAFLATLDAYRKGRIDRHIFIIGSAFLVAHLVQNVTVFENITSYLYFMFWIAMLNRLSAKPQQFEVVAGNKVVGTGWKVGVGVIILFLIVVTDIRAGQANHRSLQALRALNENPLEALPTIKETYLIDYSPHVDDIRTDVSRAIIGLLASNAKDLGTEKTNEYFAATYSALQSTIALHPLDIRTHFMLSELLQNQALTTRDIRYMQEAETIIKQALTFSTERQQLIFTLSVIDLQLGKTQEALDELMKTKASNPRIGETYWRIAFIQKVSGKYAEAVKTIADARAAQAVFTPQDEQIIAQILVPPPTTTPAVATTTPARPKATKK